MNRNYFNNHITSTLQKSITSTLLFLLITYISTAQTYKGSDLYYMGSCRITGDTAYFSKIESSDIYYLSEAIWEKKTTLLKFVKEDDLYFLGRALILKDKAELEKIKADDWFYFGTALMQDNIDFLANIQNNNVYILGKSIIEKDKDLLEKIVD